MAATADKLAIAGRHPFFLELEKQHDLFEIAPEMPKLAEAIYYASLPYEIPYCKNLQAQYEFLYSVDFVKKPKGFPPTATKLGKKFLEWLREDGLVPD